MASSCSRAGRSWPEAAAASRSVGGGVGRAAAHAAGDRDALRDREPHRRAVPAGRRAEARERARGEVLPLDAGADDLVGAAVGRGSSDQLVGERDRLDERDERVVAVGARRGR